MNKTIITLAVVALAASPAFAGGKSKSKGSFGASFGGGFTSDQSATGGFSSSSRFGNAKAQSSNENYGQSETSAKNGKVKSQQSSGSMSSSSSSSKNGGLGFSSSGGYGEASGIGGSVSAKGSSKGSKKK